MTHMTPEDIKRLNYIRYTSFRLFVKNPHSIIVCYILFIAKCIGYILLCHKKKRPIHEVLFLALSINNKKSIRTILENLCRISFTIWETPRLDMPKGKIYLRSIKYFPLFQNLYNTSSCDDKKLIRTFYESFMATCGYCDFYEKMINKNPQLKLIVFANDHSIENRCLLEIAAKHEVRTLYVQHASITKSFPPLHFTYSFLDGIESYEKYKAIGDIKGTIFLTGSPRFDELYKYKGATKTHDIGIALNLLDSCDKVMELCRYLQNNLFVKIIVRPHPRMGKLFDTQLFRRNGFDISDSTIESSFLFLSKIKFLIANESSIHLDSALIGVPSLFFNFSDNKVVDWYSYIKNGMITECESYNDVVNALRSMPSLPIEKIQYYNTSFQTPIEGKIGQFIAGFIEKIILETEEDAFQYITIPMANKIKYYEIRG